MLTAGVEVDGGVWGREGLLDPDSLLHLLHHKGPPLSGHPGPLLPAGFGVGEVFSSGVQGRRLLPQPGHPAGYMVCVLMVVVVVVVVVMVVVVVVVALE